MNKEHVIEHEIEVGTGNYVCIENGRIKVTTARGWIDYPIVNADNTISYQRPECVCQRLKQAVKKYVKELQTSRLNVA